MNQKSVKSIRSVVLIVLDGWGIAPPSQGNAITLAKTPIFNKLITSYPVFTLQASGEAVGLPWGEMGNSEVGHLNLGAGRIVWQTLPRINRSITDGSFFKNQVFLKAVEHVKKNKSNLHLLGLVSNGAVHSSIDHLYALLEFAQQQKITNVFIHAILDGRDTGPRQGIKFIQQLEERIKKVGVGQIATLSGRFYALDRDSHWERIEKAYLAMTEGIAEQSTSDPIQIIKTSYQKNIFDEEFIPTVIKERGQLVAKIRDDDAVIFFNFRPDRARELTRAFVQPGLEEFKRPRQLQNLFFVTLTEYEPGLPVAVAFPSEKIKNSLAEVLSLTNLKQFHLAETEKYAHVTFFFNGGQEQPFPNEDRLLIPSPRILSYDQKPEMSAPEVAKKLVEAILSGQYDFIVVNFANPDMVGHTGDLKATIKAIEILDRLLGEILVALLDRNGLALIVGDHGNAEELINLETGEIEKEHNTNPVPLIIFSKDFEKSKPLNEVPDLSLIKPSGVLADVAPTILKLIDLPKPEEMTGTALI